MLTPPESLTSRWPGPAASHAARSSRTGSAHCSPAGSAHCSPALLTAHRRALLTAHRFRNMAATSAALTAFAECFSGGVGGYFSSYVLFPLDVIKTRQQAGQAGKMLTMARQIASNSKYGLAGLWRGGHARGGQSMIEKIGFFYSYALVKTLWERRSGQPLGVAAQLFIGWISNVLHMPVSMPLDTIVIRMSTTGRGLSSVLVEASQQPFRNLYRGVAPYLLLGLKNAVQFAVYEPTKRWVLGSYGGGSQRPLSAVQAFWLGAFSRLISDTLLFPARRAKVLLQRSENIKGGSQAAAVRRLSMLGVLVQVVQQQGVLAVFNGLGYERLHISRLARHRPSLCLCMCVCVCGSDLCCTTLPCLCTGPS
jgi:hypothetical protein